MSEFSPASGLNEEKIQATILLVEDEIPLRRLLECLLREEGFQVYSLSNGRKALSFIDSYAGVIDVIVSVIIMPEMSGLEMAEEAALLQPSACIILISGYSRDLLMEPASNRYRRLLIKPFTKDRLINKIYDALKSRPQAEPQTAT